MLKRRHEEENTIQPSRKKPPPTEVSEDVGRGDRLMLLGLELPEIDTSSFDLELLKQFKEKQEHLQMLEARSMSCLRKSIVDIEKAFKIFKIQEMEHDAIGLVKPSGTLQARLGHYLNQPSFSTIQNVYEDGETADDSNPCIRMILENGYAENKALIMDHLHYRSHTSEDITEVDSLTLQRHEGFTSEILESLEAKVVIVYGSNVQNRLIATRDLVHMQLWGEYSEVSIALDLEKNYNFSDDNYRFRRVFLFAAHPNRIMWQTKGNRALIRQDAILKAAANMAGVSDLVVPLFYQNKLWSRDNPQRSAVLKEIRDKIQISIPKKISTSPLSIHVPNESESSGWSGFSSNQSIHNNKILAESVLPLALTILNIEGNEHQFNWSNPRELPPPVLKWIQGSRYALFNSSQLPNCDHDIIQAICDTALGTKSTTQPSFKETLRSWIEKQDTLVRRALKRNFEDSVHSEVHCGVGQGLVLCCQRCGHESIDKNPLWAVKWPGHYFQFPKTCKSRTCSWRNFEPKELHLLRTPGQVSSIVKNEGFDPDYAFRLCLRTRDECSGLEQVVESWCLLCKEQTILSGNRTNHRPQYTLGRTPLYVERRPECLRCKLTARFVPVQEIASIMPRIVRDFAEQVVYLDREVKSHLMDSVLRPSARDPR